MSRARTGSDAVRALPGLVGRRVALRYRLDTPDDSPLFTDVVGEMAEAGTTEVLVHTRRGPVRVRRNAVVAVREVPPSPPRRASLAAVARLEQVCADAWPAPLERPLGQWRLRAAGGFTARANSALAVGDPGRPVPAALDAVRAFAAEHDLAPRVQVPCGSPWHRAVSGCGWTVDERHPAGSDVAVLVAELAGLTGLVAAPPGVRLTVDGRQRWRLTAVEPVTETQRHVLVAPGLAHVGFGLAHAPDGDQPSGVARLAVVDQHLYVARLAVAERHRRRGLATALTVTAAHWAAERGARWCVLQVAENNAAALALYQRLGFTVHHHYQYLRPPGRTAAGLERSQAAPRRAARLSPDHSPR